MTATMVRDSFAAEVQVLVDVARKLGQYHKEENREEFERTLRALGMLEGEANSYWDVLSCSSTAGTWDQDRFIQLRSNTQLANYLGIALESTLHPRNKLLYRLVECHFPNLLEIQFQGSVHMGGVKSRGNPEGRRLLTFEKYPNRPGISHPGPMAIYRIFKGEEPARFQAQVLRAAKLFEGILEKEEALSLANLIFDCQMIMPPAKVAKLLAEVLRRGKGGRQVTVVGAFCPDYAYEETGNPQIPYRYTFDGVGTGVGLVAQQFARITPPFSRFLTELGIPHRIVLGIGDFEADSDAVLSRVGVEREDFIRRCAASLNAFRAQVPDDLPLTLELCGRERSQGRFRGIADESTRQMIRGHFGVMGQLYDDLNEIIARIPQQYRTFYQRWYGHEMDDQEVKNIVFAQAGEYAALAKIYADDFGPNTIILAGDRPEMHLFNAFYQSVPTLCAKRAY